MKNQEKDRKRELNDDFIVGDWEYTPFYKYQLSLEPILVTLFRKRGCFWKSSEPDTLSSNLSLKFYPTKFVSELNPYRK